MAKSPSLDQLDVPEWFADAARELKAARPKWARDLPSIALLPSGELPSTASPWVLAAIVSTEVESAKHDVMDLVKHKSETASLDAWMGAVLKCWLGEGAPERDAWVLTGAGVFGGATTARALHDAVRKWSRDKVQALAVRGVDALGRMGSKAALVEVATLSSGVRDHRVADEAQSLIERKARAAGASKDEIEDSHVSDCGLDARGERIFSYGPRHFRAILRKNLEIALLDETGRKRVALPPAATNDDPAMAEAARLDYAEMKTGIKRVAKAQHRRFEDAMITGRSWTLQDFRSRVLRHTIVNRVAQSLVWRIGGDSERTVRVTEDLSFANSADETAKLEETDLLQVAHPLQMAAEEVFTWNAVFGDYEIVQPFQQMQRAIYRCDAAMAKEEMFRAPAHPPLKPGVLYGILDNDGWRLSRAGDGRYTSSWKSFPAENVVVFISYTGFIAGALAESPEQTIHHCAFYSGVMESTNLNVTGTLLQLGRVPPVAFSETVRRLLRLTAVAGA